MTTAIGPRNPGKRQAPARETRGYLWARLAKTFQIGEPEAQDELKAQRAERLKALVAGRPVPEVWSLDLLPILQEVWDVTLRAVKDKDVSIDALVAIEKVVEAIDASIALGDGAMERMAQRRIHGMAAAEAAKERDTK